MHTQHENRFGTMQDKRWLQKDWRRDQNMQKVQKNAVNTKHKQINFSIERPFSSNKQLIHQEMWTQIS